MSAGVYVHIPFCVRKCIYCDFLSRPAGIGEQKDYLRALEHEIRILGRGQQADTVFFGGGTPSLLPAEAISQILTSIRESFCLAEDAEITLECNPGTLTEEKCAGYRRAGVNRVSLGLQSADNRILKLIGRIHTWEDFLTSFHLLRQAGFDNINVDLMSGLPGQSLSDYKDTVLKVLRLHPEHISAYSLILEEGTPLSRMIADKTRKLPEEEEEYEMYRVTQDMLREHGYSRYEISNYSLPGKECRHNLKYWNLEDYAGFGAGAASLWEGKRFRNTPDIDQYIRKLGGEENGNASPGRECPAGEKRQTEGSGLTGGNADQGRECPAGEKRQTEGSGLTDGNADQGRECPAGGDVLPEGIRTQEEILSRKAAMEEFFFLGLRMTQGVRLDRFRTLFGEEADSVYGAVIEKHRNNGMLRREGGRLFLTERGMEVSTAVLADFLQ